MGLLGKLLSPFTTASQAAPEAPKASPAATLAEPAATASAASVGALASTLTVQFEGCVLHPYQDSVGVWTIGYGSTRGFDGKPITAATPCLTEPLARSLLARDLGAAIREVQADVKVDLSMNQWAALGDFIYNVGAGNFRASTLLKKLNAKDWTGAAAEIDKWDHAGGRELSGLLRRREAEKALFERTT